MCYYRGVVLDYFLATKVGLTTDFKKDYDTKCVNRLIFKLCDHVKLACHSLIQLLGVGWGGGVGSDWPTNQEDSL